MALLVCAATAQEITALLPPAVCAAYATQSTHGSKVDAGPDAGFTAAEGSAEAGPKAGTEFCPEEMRLYPLRMKRRDAFFCVTGVGPINAALALGLCLARAAAEGQPITAVLNAGLAGAFDLQALPLSTLCLVHEEIWPEYGLHDGRSITAEAFGFPLWQRPESAQSATSIPPGSTLEADAKKRAVYDRLPLAGLEALGAGSTAHADMFTLCRSLTVAGVTAGFDRARALWDRYHAELENMEGFAAAYACAREGIPCVEIRSVSNKVGPRGKNEKDFPGALRRLGGILPALNLI